MTTALVKRTKKIRSRFGCEGCKAKRVKCDEKKPDCSRCIQRGIRCIYKIQLQFKEDLERQGKSFGREGVWSKTKAKKNEYDTSFAMFRKLEESKLFFINFESKDFHLCHSLLPSIVPADVKNQLGDLTTISHPLNYYINFISPIFNPIGSGENIYLNHIFDGKDRYIVIEKGLDLPSLIKYCQLYPHMFYLLLSLGSIYLFKQTGSAYWRKQATKFRGLAMKDIRLFNNTNLMVTCILMILYELANDCADNWALYLAACKSLLTLQFIYPTDALEISLLKFSLEFLQYQDTVGRTACKEQNKRFIEFLPDEPNENVMRIVSWMGCDRVLIDIISDITDLSFERTLCEISEANYRYLGDQISSQIDALSLRLFDGLLGYIKKEGMSSDVLSLKIDFLMKDINATDFYFLLSCEIKRLCAQLYLDCCIRNSGPHEPETQSTVKFCLMMMDMLVLKNNFSWITNLLWPLFVLSSQISSFWQDSDKLRYTVMACLEKIAKFNFGNVVKVRNVILLIWKNRDLMEEESNTLVRQKKLLGFVNDWDRFVVDKDACLSLG